MFRESDPFWGVTFILLAMVHILFEASSGSTKADKMAIAPSRLGWWQTCLFDALEAINFLYGAIEIISRASMSYHKK